MPISRTKSKLGVCLIGGMKRKELKEESHQRELLRNGFQLLNSTAWRPMPKKKTTE